MLDLRLIRRDPDAVRAALARRGDADPATIDALLAADERWRELTTQLETLQAEQNETTRALRGAPSDEQRAQMRTLAERGRALSDAQAAVAHERDELLATL